MILATILGGFKAGFIFCLTMAAWVLGVVIAFMLMVALVVGAMLLLSKIPDPPKNPQVIKRENTSQSSKPPIDV